MPYPVLAPEPPAIVYTVPVKEVTPTATDRIGETQVSAIPPTESSRPVAPATVETLLETSPSEQAATAESLGPSVETGWEAQPEIQATEDESPITIRVMSPEALAAEAVPEDESSDPNLPFKTYYFSAPESATEAPPSPTATVAETPTQTASSVLESQASATQVPGEETSSIKPQEPAFRDPTRVVSSPSVSEGLSGSAADTQTQMASEETSATKPQESRFENPPPIESEGPVSPAIAETRESTAPSSFLVGTKAVPPKLLQLAQGRLFNNKDPFPEDIPIPEEEPPETNPTPAPRPTPPTQPPTPNGPQLPTPAPLDTVEVKADRQEFDEKSQIVTAIGSVLVRFRQSVIDADRAIVNLVTRQVLAEGNVAYRRGQQVIRGQRMEFNFGLNTGGIEQASGELLIPAAGTDFSPTLPNDISAGGLLEEPLSDRLASQQPLRGVRANEGLTASIGSRRGDASSSLVTGSVNRLRFFADRLDFNPDGSRVATNIRITNDPFSPPELELRARRAVIRRISPTAEELRATSPRLVFDQGPRIPIYPQVLVFDRNRRNGPCLRVGYDRGDRGGLFAECGFDVFTKGPIQLTLTPQFYIQRAIEENGGNPFYPDNVGLRIRLTGDPGPRTNIDGSMTILKFGEFTDVVENDLRGYVRVRQGIGNHTLTGEYSYRDRLFNGTLGYQTVQRSIGAVLTSPIIPLGKDFSLSYQAGYQFINADTDRFDLLPLFRENNRIDLNRFQATAALSKGFTLWRGQALPRTPTQGLRYTPRPVVPFVQLALGIRGVTSLYSSGDSQNTLSGSIGIQGQFGHFARSYLDYTGFNVTYTQIARDGLSPFLFDRAVDLRILSFGVVQQIFGGFRVGFQSAINLSSGETISTDYTFEYSHRTYAIIVRYNPQRQIGTLTFRISDFNWLGSPEPFGGDVRTVEGGVRLSD